MNDITSYMLEQAKKILSIDSPTGFTAHAAEYVLGAYKKLGYDAKLTNKGGIFVCVNDGPDQADDPADAPILLEAHMDTLGGMVCSINEKGRLMLSALGGMNPNNAEAENCRVYTRSGKVYSGTFQLKNASIHVNGSYNDTARSYDAMEVVLDEPVESKADTEALEAVALPSEKGSADEKEASGIAQSSRAEYFVRERKETPETFVSEEELEEIFKRTYYQNSEPKSKKGYQKRYREEAPARRLMERSRAAEADRSKPRERYLLVDGYNIIFSWEMLRELSKVNIESARNLLMDVLCDYQGFNGCTLILVFDAYRVEGGQERIFNYHNIHVVFTKEAETADQYIEKTVHKIGKKADVTVATSDALEQVIIYGQGARRMAARELLEEVELTREKVLERIEKRPGSTQKQLTENDHNYLFDHLPEELVSYMEEVRLGKREL